MMSKFPDRGEIDVSCGNKKLGSHILTVKDPHLKCFQCVIGDKIHSPVFV